MSSKRFLRAIEAIGVENVEWRMENLELGEDLDEFLGDAGGAAGFSHALLAVAIDGG